MKEAIIIDTDPGIDDAVAIAIAAHNESLDLRLICTVAGNVSLDLVTQNALKLLSFFGKNIPIARGSSTPILEEYIDAPDVHGVSGLGEYEFTGMNEELLISDHAVNAMHTELMQSSEKITLVPIGPLTNIALLLKMYPEVKPKINRIVLMGGSISRGNKGIMSEFNFASDPEAAAIVFKSGLDIFVLPMELGYKALITPKLYEKLKDLNPIGNMICEVFKYYREGSLQKGFAMFDACAVAYLLNPEMFSMQEAYTEIELVSPLARGMSVVDLGGYLGKTPNSSVGVDIDSDSFQHWILEEFKKF